MYAVGFVEVSGFVSAIESLDEMVKTSNVEFLTCEKRLGGRLVTIIVKGEVSAVQAAVENGVKSANRVGKAVAHAVIPNPHSEIIRMLAISAKKYNVKSGD